MSQIEQLQRYIADLPVGVGDGAMSFESAHAIPVADLPQGLVTGSNLIQFSEETTPEVRSAVALSVLAAQRVASNDTAIMSPDQWVDRHNTILRNLNWIVDEGNSVESEFSSLNVAVHEAIIPFLTAALGPAAAAATIIVKALEQLGTMDDSKWITLFDRESRRFEVSEYQFSYVETVGSDAVMRIAAARLDAKFGKTQVLFFKVKKQHASFQAASTTMRCPTDLLEGIREPLAAKLQNQASSFIEVLPDELLG